jgi:excisionase family DNA binding protein
VTEQRSGERRKPGRPKGGRRATDPINNLATHPALNVDVCQLAEYWGKHVYTVQAYIRKGKLPAMKVGGMYRIRTADARMFERRDPQWLKRLAELDTISPR